LTLSAKVLREIGSRFPACRRLRINVSPLSDADVFDQLPKSFPNLTSLLLNLTTLKHDLWGAIGPALVALPNLHTLYLPTHASSPVPPAFLEILGIFLLLLLVLSTV